MDARQLSDWLLAQCAYDDRGLPLGWPVWWIDYLSHRPVALREAIHTFVLTYAGRAASAEADVSGLTPTIVRRILTHRPVQRMLAELGRALDTETEALADKDEVLRFWTTCMRDEHLNTAHRHKAAEALGKALGVFIEKRQVEINDVTEPGPVVDDTTLAEAIDQLRGDRFTKPHEAAEPEQADDDWMN